MCPVNANPSRLRVSKRGPIMSVSLKDAVHQSICLYMHKARRHKMTAMACAMYEMEVNEIYDSWFLLLLRGSEGAHPPLLLQRCAAVPHDSQRQKWHGCKQGAGSGRPNLHLSSQWGAALPRLRLRSRGSHWSSAASITVQERGAASQLHRGKEERG